MCWLAIPPGTDLPALDPEFHCTGSKPKTIRDYFKAIESLNNRDEILMFTFEFEEGEIFQKTNDNLDMERKIVEARHLNFWQYTLPLVLEKISEQSTEKVSVDIFIEQALTLESGIGVLEPIVRIKKWDKLIFDQLYVISKGEHPWIGYPDALGHVINQTKNKHLNDEQFNIQQSVYDSILKFPYRESSLIKVVNPAIVNTSLPHSFCKFKR